MPGRERDGYEMGNRLLCEKQKPIGMQVTEEKKPRRKILEKVTRVGSPTNQRVVLRCPSRNDLRQRGETNGQVLFCSSQHYLIKIHLPKEVRQTKTHQGRRTCKKPAWISLFFDGSNASTTRHKHTKQEDDTARHT